MRSAALWTAIAAAAGSALPAAAEHRIAVQADVPLLPGKAAEVASLPGPLAALDPDKDLDAVVLAATAFRQALDQARRKLAAEMSRTLSAEPKWAVRDLTWPRTPPAKEPGRVTVVALFEKTPVKQSSSERAAGQTKLLNLFGKVSVVVGYRLDSRCLKEPPAELLDPINAELRRGDWAITVRTDCRPTDDAATVAKQAGKDADLVLLITARDKEPSEFCGFFRTEGSAEAAVFRRDGARWLPVHRVVLLGAKQTPEILPDAPALSREGAGRDVHRIIGRDLVERGHIHDLCCRAFAAHFGAAR